MCFSPKLYFKCPPLYLYTTRFIVLFYHRDIYMASYKHIWYSKRFFYYSNLDVFFLCRRILSTTCF